MVDFASALQIVGAGLSTLKELNQLDHELDKATLKLKVAELSGALASAQLALSEAQIEATKKDSEIAKLQANFKRKDAETVIYHGFVYQKGADGKPEGLPFCPRCLDNGKMMLVVSTVKEGRPQMCPECKSEFRATEFVYR